MASTAPCSLLQNHKHVNTSNPRSKTKPRHPTSDPSQFTPGTTAPSWRRHASASARLWIGFITVTCSWRGPTQVRKLRKCRTNEPWVSCREPAWGLGPVWTPWPRLFEFSIMLAYRDERVNHKKYLQTWVVSGNREVGMMHCKIKSLSYSFYLWWKIISLKNAGEI